MPTYSGSFPLAAQGHAVTVKLDGVALTDPAPGNVGSTVRNGQLTYAYTYSAGDDDTTLEATVQTSAGLVTAYLELDSTASIEAGGGGGSPTADTAFLLATGTVAADGSNHNLSLAFDDRFPEVDWLTVAGDTATIPDGAGKCVIGIIAGGSINFTGASATPDTPGLIDSTTQIYTNGSTAGGVSTNDEVVANGDTVQNFNDVGPEFAINPVDFGVGDEVTIVVTSVAYTDDAYEDAVTGAHATFTVAVAITRGGSAPTLP